MGQLFIVPTTKPFRYQITGQGQGMVFYITNRDLDLIACGSFTFLNNKSCQNSRKISLFIKHKLHKHDYRLAIPECMKR